MKYLFSRFSTLVVEIILTLGICVTIGFSTLNALQLDAEEMANSVDIHYHALTKGYLSAFRSITLMVREEVDKDPSFEAFDSWLKAHETAFKTALGAHIYDGYYATYQGKLARSWSYGNYSAYDPHQRPWYQLAEEAKGKAVVVPPYSSYLADSSQTAPTPVLLTIAQKYSNTVYFALDLKINDVNDLLVDRVTDYDGALMLLLDKTGAILSANDKRYYDHNVNKIDDVVNSELQTCLQKMTVATTGHYHFASLNGNYKLIFVIPMGHDRTFCMFLPFREVFVHKFLFPVLATFLLILLEIFVFLANRHRFAVLKERDRRRTAITDTAFQKQYYVDLTSMKLEENDDSKTVAKDSYLQVYNMYLPHIAGDLAQAKFQRLFSPETLCKTKVKGMTSIRIPVNMVQTDGKYQQQIIEFSLIVADEGGTHAKSATILVKDVTKDERHNLMILRSLASHYSHVFMGNVKTRHYEVIKVETTVASDMDEWQPELFVTEIKEADRAEFLDAVSFERILLRLKNMEAYVITIQFVDGHWYTLQIIRSITYEDSGEFFVCLEHADQQMQRQQVLEEALRKVEVAAQAKSDFLSRMSHDIRTPLNGILGMTGIALKSSPSPVIKKYLDTIDTSGHFLLGLINNILDVVKIESGKFELHERPTSLSEFKEMIQAVIVPLMEEKQLHFTFDFNVHTNYAQIDVGRFSQIFFNLLSNSAKFTPAGGDVTFSATSMKVEDDVEWVRFIVRDNGIGMTPEFMKKLFDPFEQEHDNNDAVQWQGTGLGLSIVKELTEIMQGRISVTSEKGKGTTFTLDIPIKICMTDVPVTDTVVVVNEEERNKILAGKTVLLVEDNDINTVVVKTLLEDKDIHVLCATDGQKAIASFKAHEAVIDLILMDVMMPILNGIEATREIRRMATDKSLSVPIIAVTANAFAEDVRACKAAGMNAHLSKPIEPDQLYAILLEYLHE